MTDLPDLLRVLLPLALARLAKDGFAWLELQGDVTRSKHLRRATGKEMRQLSSWARKRRHKIWVIRWSPELLATARAEQVHAALKRD